MNFNRLHEEETERLALLSSSLGKVTQAVSDVILHGYEDQPRDSEATYRTLLEKVIGGVSEFLCVRRSEAFPEFETRFSF